MGTPLDRPEAIDKARAFVRNGDLSAAVDCLEAAASTVADPSVFIFELGNLLKASGLLDQAESAFRRVMEHRPSSIEAATNLANVLALKGDTATAIAILNNVQAVAPGVPLVEMSLADALFLDDRLEEALALYDELAVTYPDSPSAHANRGEALARLGRHEDAIAALDNAVDLDPGAPAALRNRGFSKLALGDLTGGLADYEARLDPALPDAPVRIGLSAPRWDGGALADGPLLVVAEQGLGDEIRFAAALPRLLDRVSDVIVECDPRLVDLFSASLGDARVIPFNRRRDGARPVYDYTGLPVPPAAWIEAGSVPHLLAPPLSVPMATMGFIATEPQRVMLSRARFKAESAGRPLVGFCWGSGAAERARSRFYPPLDAWRAILSSLDVTFVDLQYVSSDEDRAKLAKMSGAEILPTDEIDKRNDLTAAACLAAAMDAVVGVSSSVAAMAAAVGTPTVEVTPERTWVPLIGGRDAWLGSIVSAHPDRPGDWDQAIARAVDLLSGILDPRG